MIKEKNIKIFNGDVRNTGNYLYTKENVYSAVTATKRQSEEIIRLLKRYFSRNIKILDVGCGDGTYTLEIYKNFPCKKIIGFDMAQDAIQAARLKIRKPSVGKIQFIHANIYSAKEKLPKKSFDVGIIRGVLHHLYQPKKAINHLSSFLPAIIVLEPNGYNPILKVIEKISPYHRLHEEKSYKPSALDSWFLHNNYRIVDKKYIGIVPYFCPKIFVNILKIFEPFIEGLPFVNKLLTGAYVVLYMK